MGVSLAKDGIDLPRRYTSRVVRAAMLATLATVIASGGTLGHAAPRGDALQSLGDAFRAYDDGDLASAETPLAKLGPLDPAPAAKPARKRGKHADPAAAPAHADLRAVRDYAL